MKPTRMSSLAWQTGLPLLLRGLLAAGWLLSLGLSGPPAAPVSAANHPPQPPALQPALSQSTSPVEGRLDVNQIPPAPSPAQAGPIVLPLLSPDGEGGGTPGDPNFIDPLAQRTGGAGRMPAPLLNFAGLDSSANLTPMIPPDPNGDVGPRHYVQAVNLMLGIYDKTTGARIGSPVSFNAFFDGTGTACDNSNRGDPIVLYDRLAGRWLVSDFAWLGNVGPFYECVAISQTDDPLGAWRMFAFKVSDTALNDYPKVGVWPDGYYFTFNLYTQPGDVWQGVQVWALNREQMLSATPQTVQTVAFTLGPDSGYASLLPANALSLPPAGAPNYVISVAPPGAIQVWNFQVDWNAPANSTFTGPSSVPVSAFSAPVDPQQPGTQQRLDSIGFRPMMHLNYRVVNGVPALWFNQTVNSQGVDAIRWYELRPQSGQMTLNQEGTYQPDSHHRWMGSAAVDKDGNLAVGYSVSSSSLLPSIRYAGRLAGETKGLLPQAEATLAAGSGYQTTYNRWGDYSSMSVDPSDDCTFWYTNEYYTATGTNWQTRIGAFKFPSCGEPKATLTGVVRNAVTSQPVAGAPVVAASPALTLTGTTDANGTYNLTVIAGSYRLTAGPRLPGYPISATLASPVTIAAGETITREILLAPVPNLIHSRALVDDATPPAQSNPNGSPEPGEQNLRLWEFLANSGAVTSTNITAHLISLTPGVTVTQADSNYANIPPAGAPISNTVPFIFSISSQIQCGADLQFQEKVTDDSNVYTVTFSLNASVPLPRSNVFADDVEQGNAGWAAETPWGITAAQAHSPQHSWTDSPAGNYDNYADTSLRSPTFDLTGKRGIQIAGWSKFALEPGYDYVTLEASLDNGATWSGGTLLALTGVQAQWQPFVVDAPALAGQAQAALRFRLKSDGAVTADGVYLDDLSLSYAPYYCNYPRAPRPEAPALTSPSNGRRISSPVTLQWQAGAGGAPVGYVLTLDSANPITLTTPVTHTTLSLAPGLHTWSVQAYNWTGVSPASPTWNFEVDQSIFLPFLPIRGGW